MRRPMEEPLLSSVALPFFVVALTTLLCPRRTTGWPRATLKAGLGPPNAMEPRVQCVLTH